MTVLVEQLHHRHHHRHPNLSSYRCPTQGLRNRLRLKHEPIEKKSRVIVQWLLTPVIHLVSMYLITLATDIPLQAQQQTAMKRFELFQQHT